MSKKVCTNCKGRGYTVDYINGRPIKFPCGCINNTQKELDDLRDRLNEVILQREKDRKAKLN